MRSRRLTSAALAALTIVAALTTSTAAAVPRSSRAATAAFIDRQNLRLAAYQIEAQALAARALHRPVTNSRPAAVVFQSVNALLRAARADGAARAPIDTRPLMGPVPFNLSHRIAHRPWHRHVAATHTLRRFRSAVYVGGSSGIGLHTTFRHSLPAANQRSDGVYVDPHVAAAPRPTVAAVAIRAALKKLGHPYVWAAAARTPSTAPDSSAMPTVAPASG